MKKFKKSPYGFGVVKREKLGGRWVTVVAPDKLISSEECVREIREIQRKMRNGNGD